MNNFATLTLRAFLIGVTIVTHSTSALAHHSFAMFDDTKLVTLDGTLYRVEWANPHSWMWIVVPDATKPDGKQIWALEGAGPAAFAREGFTKKDFVIGTKMKVDMHPMKDGSMAGQFLRATFSDGRVVGDLRTPIDVLKQEGVIK